MQKKFVQNVLFLVFLNLIIKPFWLLGIDRTVQNRVGPEEYGVYFALFNFSFLLQIILDLGISNFNSRNISQHRQLLEKYVPNILTIKMGLALLYLSCTFLLAFIWNYSTYKLQLLGILALNQVLVSLNLYLRSNLTGLHLFKLDAIFSVMDRFLMIMICAVLLWTPITGQPFQIEWFIYAQTFSLFITAVLCGTTVLRQTKQLSFQWDYRLLLVILRQSYPFAILGVLMSIYNRIDGVMIEKLSPDNPTQEAGLYANAYRILDAVTMISFLFSTLLLPIFARLIRLGQPTAPVTKISVKTLLVPVCIFSVTAFVYREPIMYALYTHTTEYSSLLFGILILNFIPLSAVYVFGTLLTANGNMKLLNISSLIGVTLNIILNVILVLKYNALGATFATLATQYFIGITQTVYAIRVFRYKIPPMSVLKFLLLLGSVALMSVFGDLIPVQWFIQFILVLLGGSLLGIGLGLIDIKALYQLVLESQEEK